MDHRYVRCIRANIDDELVVLFLVPMHGFSEWTEPVASQHRVSCSRGVVGTRRRDQNAAH